MGPEAANERTGDITTTGPAYADLLDYYLACIGAEDRPEASFFAKSKYDPDYVEITGTDSQTLGTIPGAADLVKRVDRDASKQLFVGGLPYLKHIKARKSNWQGFIVYPLLVAPIDVANGTVDLDDVTPFISLDALQEINGGQSASSLLEELLSLEEAIGLDRPTGSAPAIEVAAEALRTERPGWPWQSDSSTAISALNQVGLFDRWFLFGADKTVFTLGLSNDLTEMAEMLLPEDTALSAWVEGSVAPAEGEYNEALLEPLVLNAEQHHAVELSLTQPLTVVTGPPGRGTPTIAPQPEGLSCFRLARRFEGGRGA